MDINWNIIKGVRVFHQRFGYGKIIHIEGDKAKVDFDIAEYLYKRVF